MLQARENNPASEKSKSKKENNQPILKTDHDRIENYLNLIYQISSELGFIIPNNKCDNDPFKQKYQPSLKYRECLKDLQKILFKIFNDNLDIFDLIRCRIGEWKFMQNHFLPLLTYLINATPIGNNDIYLLLDIINALIFSVEDDDSVKSAYFNDLVHHNCIYKKHFSHNSIMGAFTTLIASTMSYSSRDEINYEPLKQVTRLLKNILLSPEAEISKGNLIQTLAYGKKETVIGSMYKSKMCDLIFSLASSVNDRVIFRSPNDDVSVIFADLFCIIASIFDDVDISQLFSLVCPKKSENLSSQKPLKKPIRHGRFSGSVSVQLSTGENIVINDSKLFAVGIPGSLDVMLRRNGKLEGKMTTQTRAKLNLSSEDRVLLFKLSVTFLESYFNIIFALVSEKRTCFELEQQHKTYLLQIASYFMEFCRYSVSDFVENHDYYKLIYGMINVRFILDNIDYLHELISSKNYPLILRVLPYFKEMLLLVHSFANSYNEQRRAVSANIQKQLLHSKNVLLLIRRVIMISKPVIKYFLHICIECNDILFKLTKKYSENHEYWHVSSLSCAEIFSRENDLEGSDDFNIGQESNFNFESLVKHYSSREVIEFYCQALTNCSYEHKDYNSMIGRYLYFVIKSEYFYKSLMRPSVIVLLQKIINGNNSWMQHNKELVIVANKIVRKFSSLLMADPSYLVLSFFN